MDVYNKNRDQNNSIHDEIREQNAKLKDAPLKEKLSYFKDYYLKTTIIIIIALIFLGNIAYTMITAPEDTGFAAFFFNDTGDSSSTAMLDEFVSYAGIDTKEHEAYIDATMNYNPEASDFDAYSGLEKSMAVISTGELDVIIGDSEAFDYFCKSECFPDITTVLPDDLMEQFKDKLYYYTNEETGETLPLGIYVTDSPKLNEYYYYVDKEPILGFLVNSNSMENAITFLRYLYTE
ncbi:MAG: hypothetical protein MR531_05965 [Lachnospiraceae bacterium]|nr:hypothetical protein [Lachnospiraceae bacterium]